MTLRSVRRRFSEERIERSVSRILRDSALCSISTVAPQNRAHINTAYFAFSPDLVLYFLSDPASLHCRNLRRNPSMAMTVFDSTQTWGGQDRGLQFFGTCRRTLGARAMEAERVYAKRFRPYATWMQGTGQVERRQAAQLRSYAFFRFAPSKVKVFDEQELGAGVFVVASVRRDRDARGSRKAVSLRWQSTEVLLP